MLAQTAPRDRSSDWIARGVLAGFAASVVMLLGILASFTVLRVLSRTSLPDSTLSNTFHSWVLALLTNRAMDLAAVSFAAAAALHLILGISLALVYSAVVEPRRTGPAWLSGALFALFPCALSLAVFFPILGAGLLGLNLGAGPLPALGNLLLHLLYGATLGAAYQALGRSPEIPRSESRSALGSSAPSSRRALREIGGGALIGAVLAVAGALAQAASHSGLVLPMSTLLGIAIIFGAAFGAAVGSLGGIAPAPRKHHQRDRLIAHPS